MKTVLRDPDHLRCGACSLYATRSDGGVLLLQIKTMERHTNRACDFEAFVVPVEMIIDSL